VDKFASNSLSETATLRISNTQQLTDLYFLLLNGVLCN
jgi:hypothetical protein